MTTLRYAVSLHYDTTPAELSIPSVTATLTRRGLSLRALNGEDGSVELSDVDEGKTRWLVESDGAPFELALLRNSLEQSWNWREAAEVIASCRSAIRIEEWSDGDAAVDINRFRSIVAAIVEAWEPKAIHWIPAQHFINPADFTTSMNDDDPLYGPLNIRMFHIEGQTAGPIPLHDEFVMDTIGLAPLGITDLQCHFKMLDRTRVAQVLYQTAYYLFERGVALKTGDSVDGITEGSEWLCREQETIFPPERKVIDLDPGKEFAAARRV